MASRMYPFDLAAPSPLASLAADASRKWKWIEVTSRNKLYGLLNAYVPCHLVSESDPDYEAARAGLVASDAWTQSYRADVIPGKKKKVEVMYTDDESDMEDQGIDAGQGNKKCVFNRVALRTGFGVFCFRDTQGRPTLGLHQRIGDPVGAGCGADHMTSWLLFTSGKVSELAQFLSLLVEGSEQASSGEFPCFTWSVQQQFWIRETSVRARPLSSVVLPATTKSRLVKDIEQFLSPETAAFYLRHGIPYRRSYLFHGLPGTGKTSLVQAMAGHFERSVCFLQPTHPHMTDDSLRAAMTGVPDGAIVVLEDIDSLFDRERSNKVSKSCLTFSGLLNALDGIGSPNGQIFVLTTNLREQLDPALIRSGRVDIQFEFTYATEEQVCDMWRSFYPDAAALAPDFHTALRRSLDGRPIVTSALQHFFVQQMRSTADEALANTYTIIEDLIAKDVEAREAKEAEAARGKGEGADGRRASGRGGRGARHSEHSEAEDGDEVGTRSDSESGCGSGSEAEAEPEPREKGEGGSCDKAEQPQRSGAGGRSPSSSLRGCTIA